MRRLLVPTVCLASYFLGTLAGVPTAPAGVPTAPADDASVRVALTDKATGQEIPCSRNQAAPVDTAAAVIHVEAVFVGSGATRTKGALDNESNASIWYQATQRQAFTGQGQETLLLEFDQLMGFPVGTVRGVAAMHPTGSNSTCWVRVTDSHQHHPLLNEVSEGEGEEFVVDLEIRLFSYSDGPDGPFLECGQPTRASRVGFDVHMRTSKPGSLVDLKLLYEGIPPVAPGEHAHWLQKTYRVVGSTRLSRVALGVQQATAPGPHEFHVATLDEQVIDSCALNFQSRSRMHTRERVDDGQQRYGGG
jgi:hypothetical protein